MSESGAVQLGQVQPLPGDGQTIVTAERTWKSPGATQCRRGVVVLLLYTPSVRGPSRTILTVRTCSGSFSFQPVDLESGPLLVTEYGFFVRALTQPEPAPDKDARASMVADLLVTKMNAGEGGADRSGWGSTQTPCVYANTAKEPAMLLGGLIQLPPRSVAVHPGPDRDVAVGWRSPVAGTVAVTAKY